MKINGYDVVGRMPVFTRAMRDLIRRAFSILKRIDVGETPCESNPWVWVIEWQLLA